MSARWKLASTLFSFITTFIFAFIVFGIAWSSLMYAFMIATMPVLGLLTIDSKLNTRKYLNDIANTDKRRRW